MNKISSFVIYGKYFSLNVHVRRNLIGVTAIRVKQPGKKVVKPHSHEKQCLPVVGLC